MAAAPPCAALPEAVAHLVAQRIAIREMSADAFVEAHASGTLRKNKRLGMRWRDQYMAERTAYEFGWEFTCTPRSRVTFGEAYTEGDCHAITEAGWHIERYATLSIFPEDVCIARYISVEEADGTRREGLGIVVEKTSAPFVPESHIVYAIISEYDPTAKRWREPRNPF